MTLGVDHYLAWVPAELATGAAWLGLKSDLVEESANAIREAGERGTEGQCGQFITRRREDAGEIARRAHELGDLLWDAGEKIRRAKVDLEPLVAELRIAENKLLDRGFVRDGDAVRDTRATYADAEERLARKNEATEFEEWISNRVNDIRAVDERVNRELHALVGREVRDRTAAGNGDPRATDTSTTAMVTATASTGASLLSDKWFEAVIDSGRGLTMAYSLVPVMTVLGFLGGVAARPEDEPLHEAIVAEGVGTVAGTAGSVLIAGLGALAGGPPGALAGGLGGGAVAAPRLGAWASSWVRGAFDRAN